MDKVSFDDTLTRDRKMEPRVKSSTLVVFAFLQILFGGILIFTGIVAINLECFFAYIGMPIYAGVLVIITGLIGIVSALKKTDQMTLTSLVFSFLSATFCAVALVIVMAVALDYEDNYRYMYRDKCWDRDRDAYNETCLNERNKPMHKKQAVDTFILMMAICEGVVAFINGILCSRILCCRGNQGCCIQANTSSMQSCWKGFWKSAIPCCQPPQMYIYLGQADGTTLPIPLKTVPAEKGNAIVAMIPTNTTKVNGNDSKDIERQ
ncbi:uncharacterized protein [Ptychodera flava]|uniref:uncharacterized protein isoform X2 n=1 Tax=Ptychodera flava TaxID=63121 RepID=UPI00396A474A